jgi:Domain of unknown function (DUF4126)
MTGLIVGSGWASGINLYGVVALLNIYGRLGLGDVPEVLQRTDVLVIALILYSLEFVADKVPYLDNIWDVVHTAIRPLGAAILGWIMVGDASGLNQFVATIGAGGLALVSHATKATTRVAVNTSPEPVSNSVVSLAEDGLVAVVVFLAVEYPIIAIAVVIVLLVVGVYLMVKLIGLARKGIAKIRTVFSN